MNEPIAFRSYDKFTQAQFADWLETLPPGDLYRYELLDGFIVREPPAGWPHGQVEVEIGSRLSAFVKPRKLGITFGSSQGFDLPSGDTVEPDICFVSKERWKKNPGPGFLRVVPDLVFEILSPGTKHIDRKQKKRIYAKNSVQGYVLVDPKSRSMDRFCLAGEAFGDGRRFAAEEDYESLALPGFTFAVGELFLQE